MPHLESGDGDAEQLELLREVEDGEEDGAEEGDLQEAEHDQPREQEVAHSPAASKGEREVTKRGREKIGGRELRREWTRESCSHLAAPMRRMTEGSRKMSWMAPAIRMWVWRKKRE